MPFIQLMTSDGSKAGLQDQLNQRDALLATLQEQTAQLLLQYQQSSEEVNLLYKKFAHVLMIDLFAGG